MKAVCVFHSRTQTFGAGSDPSWVLLYMMREVLARAVRQVKETKSIQMGKKETEYLYWQRMWFYIERTLNSPLENYRWYCQQNSKYSKIRSLPIYKYQTHHDRDWGKDPIHNGPQKYPGTNLRKWNTCVLKPLKGIKKRNWIRCQGWKASHANTVKWPLYQKQATDSTQSPLKFHCSSSQKLKIES